MIQERNRIIPDEENLIWVEDQVRNVKRLSLRSFGVREERIYRERSEKSEENCVEPLYRKVIKLDRSRGVEIKSACFICRRAV